MKDKLECVVCGAFANKFYTFYLEELLSSRTRAPRHYLCDLHATIEKMTGEHKIMEWKSRHQYGKPQWEHELDLFLSDTSSLV